MRYGDHSYSEYLRPFGYTNSDDFSTLPRNSLHVQLKVVQIEELQESFKIAMQLLNSMLFNRVSTYIVPLLDFWAVLLDFWAGPIAQVCIIRRPHHIVTYSL